MQITISGRNLSVGQSLQEYADTELSGAVSKYFDRAIFADVTFSKEAHLFSCDIICNEGTGKNMMIKAQAKTDEIYSAFDQCVSKIEKQLRRYKRKLINQRNDQGSAVDMLPASATKYVLADDGQEMDDDNPLIIAEKQTLIETFTVSDAVMRMNLADLPALMFINKKTNAVNLVYRRKDGNISWVDSECQYKVSPSQAA